MISHIILFLHYKISRTMWLIIRWIWPAWDFKASWTCIFALESQCAYQLTCSYVAERRQNYNIYRPFCRRSRISWLLSSVSSVVSFESEIGNRELNYFGYLRKEPTIISIVRSTFRYHVLSVYLRIYSLFCWVSFRWTASPWYREVA